MKDLPQADTPEWGKPYNWQWFKYHHFDNLQKCYTDIKNHYKKLPLGKALSQADIRTFLDMLDKVIELEKWLPVSGGGSGNMEEIIKARSEYENAYLEKEENTLSYWHAQELEMKVFALYNYMEACCGD